MIFNYNLPVSTSCANIARRNLARNASVLQTRTRSPNLSVIVKLARRRVAANRWWRCSRRFWTVVEISDLAVVANIRVARVFVPASARVILDSLKPTWLQSWLSWLSGIAWLLGRSVAVVKLVNDAHVATVADALIEVPDLPVLKYFSFKRAAPGRRISRWSRFSRRRCAKVNTLDWAFFAKIVIAAVFVPLLVIHVVFALESATLWIRIAGFTRVKFF